MTTRIFASPYIGQVATRGRYPETRLPVGQNAIVSRVQHHARAQLIGARFTYLNYFGAEEKGSGGPARIRVSIEYPAGNFIPLTFEGHAEGTMDDNGAISSDPLSVNIPDGAIFQEWVWARFTKGALGASTTPRIDQARIQPSGTDAERPEDVPGMSPAYLVYGASAITGATTKPSVLILGDSRAAGTAASSGTNDNGNVARSIGSGLGYINLSVSGAAMWQVRMHHRKTAHLAEFSTHLVIAGHITDIIGAPNLQALKENIQGLISKFGNKDMAIWVCTVEPYTTSTDGWMTTAGQRPWDPVKEKLRVAFNDYLRSGEIDGVTGCFDLADAVESERNSGLWTAGPNHTDDGLHANTRGELMLMRALNPALFGINAYRSG